MTTSIKTTTFIALASLLTLATGCGGGGGGGESAGLREDSASTVVRSGYMLQGVFDSKNDSGCTQGDFQCVNGAFPIDEAARRLCAIPEPVFSVAWKSYGNDVANFHRLVSAVTTCRPNAVVRVSFEHGPSRPPRFWRGYWTFAPEIRVGEFNSRIQEDEAFRNSYREYLASIRAETVDRYPNTHFIFFGIEDNWSCAAFGAVYDVWKGVFGDVSTAEFMRNPVSADECPLDREFRREVHGVVTTEVLRGLRAGDIYCPDGAYHAISTDNLESLQPRNDGPRVASYDEALALAQTMKDRGIWFEQWYPELQAVTRADVARFPSPPPMRTTMQFMPWEEDARVFSVHQGVPVR